MPEPLRIPKKESEYLARRGRKSPRGIAFQYKGDEVEHLQKALVALGYPLPKHGVDRKFWLETERAVRKFQEDHNDLFVTDDEGKNPPLQKDGIVGPKTALALNCALARAGIWFNDFEHQWTDKEGPHRTRCTGGTTIPSIDPDEGEEVRLHITPTQVPRYPIIFIPGIMGSELVATIEKEKEIVWMTDDEDYLVDYLGDPNANIKPSKIIRTAGDYFGTIGREWEDAKIYVDTIRFFGKLGFKLGKDFFEFPYDWRLDLRDAAKSLKTFVDKHIKGKFIMIAHSMGGLVARKYAQDVGAEKIAKLFMLGTPNHGSPMAFRTLRYGEHDTLNSYPINFTEESLQEAAIHILGLYQLLPSHTFFELYKHRKTEETCENKSTYGGCIFSYHDHSKDTLTTESPDTPENTYLKGQSQIGMDLDDELNAGWAKEAADRVKNALDFHKELGRLARVAETHLIVGSDIDTLGEIRVEVTKGTLWGTDTEVEKKYIKGDETVPDFSVWSLDDVPEERRHLFSNVTHGDLPKNQRVLKLIKKIIGEGECIGDCDNPKHKA